jgi:hypothetical protein
MSANIHHAALSVYSDHLVMDANNERVFELSPAGQITVMAPTVVPMTFGTMYDVPVTVSCSLYKFGDKRTLIIPPLGIQAAAHGGDIISTTKIPYYDLPDGMYATCTCMVQENAVPQILGQVSLKGRGQAEADRGIIYISPYNTVNGDALSRLSLGTFAATANNGVLNGISLSWMVAPLLVV